MLCGVCREGCTDACYLAAEDAAFHYREDAGISWDDLDSDVSA